MNIVLRGSGNAVRSQHGRCGLRLSRCITRRVMSVAASSTRTRIQIQKQKQKPSQLQTQMMSTRVILPLMSQRYSVSSSQSARQLSTSTTEPKPSSQSTTTAAKTTPTPTVTVTPPVPDATTKTTAETEKPHPMAEQFNMYGPDRCMEVGKEEWIEVWSDKHNKPYYYHLKHREPTWDRPNIPFRPDVFAEANRGQLRQGPMATRYIPYFRKVEKGERYCWCS
jgi:WW domain